MFGSRENKLLRQALALYAGEHVLRQVIKRGLSFLSPRIEEMELTMLYFDI